MILVDSNVLIEFLRTKDAKLDRLFRSSPVAICGVMRAEILCGARNPRDRQRLETFLSRFQQLAIPEVLWDKVGDNLAALQAKVITIPFPDVVIATLGIA